MAFIFKNRTIFWDIPKWNRGQIKWDGGSTKVYMPHFLDYTKCSTLFAMFEKSNFLREYHLLFCLPFKNI